MIINGFFKNLGKNADDANQSVIFKIQMDVFLIKWFYPGIFIASRLGYNYYLYKLVFS